MKKGTHHSPETMAKLRKIGREYPKSRMEKLWKSHTLESRKRQGQTMRKHHPAGPTHFNFGSRRSKETREKMSKIAIGKHRGINNGKWTGGIIKHDKGYILILSPHHPSQRTRGYVFEHRLVAEKLLGRFLESTEDCHHLNKNKSDNRPKNLMVFKSRAAHLSFEAGKNVSPEQIIFDGRIYHTMSLS